MARTFKDRHDGVHFNASRNAIRMPDAERYGKVMRYSMGRYIRANARGSVEHSARWFAAVDRSSRLMREFD